MAPIIDCRWHKINLKLEQNKLLFKNRLKTKQNKMDRASGACGKIAEWTAEREKKGVRDGRKN